jgi:hypothetical protein
VADDDPRIRAALWFAEHGFGVFSCWSAKQDGTCRCPKGATCGSPGKHPITDNGFQDATQDSARIRAMLSAASRPNYGLVCPEGVFAWDVDGEGWEARLAALEATHGQLPPTLRTVTAHGQHVFLRWPDGLPRPLHRMFGWVTRWGAGRNAGYVIGPRSIHPSGHEYAPAGEFTIGTLPEAWARAVLDAEHGDDGTIRIGGSTPPEQVAVGGRHDWLRDRARFLAGVIRDPVTLLNAMLAENERLPQPKSREDVERAIGDVLVRFGPDPVEADPETGEARVVSDAGDPGMLPQVMEDGRFPPPPAREAFAGHLGDVVEFLAPDTDASEVGMLASLLAFCGVLMPARGYLHAYHPSAPFIALVGKTGIGRKGTAMYKARDVLGNAIGIDVVNRARLNGIASGEAMVKALLDRERDSMTYGNPTGVLFEEEYATYLAAAGREGSTLDSRMRAAFDGMSLAQRKAAESVVVREPYWLAGLVAITPKELQTKALAETFYSGSGNRWLWLPVARRQVDPGDGGPPILPPELSVPLVDAHRENMRVPPLLPHDPGVARLMSEYDAYLREETIGIAADMSRRYGVIAFRVGLVHAAVERAGRVTVGHYRRGLALTEYARAGLLWTFGESMGNRAATLLYRHLREAGSLTSQIISKYIIRDIERRQDAIDELQRAGVAEVVRVKTGGRTRSELRLVAGSGDFRDFRALIPTPREAISPEPARKRSDDRAEGARKGAEEREADARKGAETSEGSPRGDTWASPCRDYARHTAMHRRTPNGWLCDACEADIPSGICPICGVGPFLSVEFFDRHQAQEHGA